MKFIGKLPIPKEIKEKYPPSAAALKTKAERDTEVRNIFEGKSGKFLLILGPCSADSEKPVLEYVSRLAILQEKVSDKILIIPRVYTSKPRTSGEGYMGMLHQPDPNGKPDLLLGIVAVRKLYLKILEETGFGCADELLYCENYRYMSDLLSYVAVGARSVENQQHRLTASGLDIPVGMKNPVYGDLEVMMNSVRAARLPHTFLYRGWEVYGEGNPLAHAVLRGYTDSCGRYVNNCTEASFEKIQETSLRLGIDNPAVIVDTNHANSGKNYLMQPKNALDAIKLKKSDSAIGALMRGLMTESYILDGCVATDGTGYGRSITDSCLGIEKTEKLVTEIADAL